MKQSKQKKVVVLGATGQVGRAVVNALSKQGMAIDLLVRRPERHRAFNLYHGLRVRPIQDWHDVEGLTQAFEQADVVINLLADLTAGAENIDQADLVASTQKIKKAIETARVAQVLALSQMGADASNARDPWLYQLGEADAITLTISHAAVSVVRAGLLLGPDDQLSSRFAAQLKRMPVLPVHQPGLVVQPLAVSDFAKALLQVLAATKGQPQKWVVAGDHQLTLKDLAQTVADIMEKPNAMILPMCRFNARLMAALGELAPVQSVSAFQLKTLRSDKVTDVTFSEQFGYAPMSVEQTLAQYLASENVRVRYQSYRQEAGRSFE